MINLIHIIKAQTLQVGVQTDPQTVQTPSAKLKIYGQLFRSVPSGGFVQIIAPTELTVNSGSLTCSIIIPSTGGVSSCSASGKTITIFLSKSLPADAFEIHINSVLTNPQSTTLTNTFQFFTFSASGTVLDQLTTGIQLQATEGGMSSSSLTPASQVVGATTSLEVKFKPVHSIPAGGVIRVSFPKWNPDSTSQVEYFQGAISCTTVAVLSSNLQCSFSNSVLIVTGGAQVTISGGTEVGFKVSVFRNPISTSTISGFQIVTQDSTSGSIDRAIVTLKVSTAGTISSASVTVDDSVNSAIAGVVQETNKLRLTFTSPVPLNSNCNIKVNLPIEFSVSTVTSISVFGIFGATSTITALTKSTVDNSFAFTQCSTYLSNALPANIIIESLTLPKLTRTTASFGIYVRNSNSDLVAEVTSGVTFKPITGTIPTPSISALNPVILATTKLQIDMLPAHTIEQPNRLVLVLPSSYVLGSTCIFTNVLNTNNAATCTVSGQTVTVNNFLSTDYIGGSGKTLKFTIEPVTLPQSTQTVSGFSFTTFIMSSTDQQYYSVDTFSGSVPVTINFGSITNIITPGSFIAYDVVSYAFKVTPQHYIPRNGYIKVIYPSEISIPDSSFSQSQCGGFSGFPTTPTCVINTSDRTITINNGFRTTTVPAGGTQFQFTIPGVQNPISEVATSTFQIYSYTSGDEIMDQQITGLSIKMTSTALMKSVILTSDTYVNSAIAKYTFSITPTSPVTANNYVVIKFPSEIKLPTSQSSLACYSDDNLILSSVTCTFNTNMIANSIKAVLAFRTSITQINNLQTFRITVQGMRNPNSTKPSSNIQVNVTDKTFTVVNTAPQNIFLQTTEAYVLSKASISANVSGAGQSARINITIYPEHDIQVNGGIFVQYPSQMGTLTTITAQVLSTYSKSAPSVTFDKSSRQILIKNAFQFKVIGNSNNPIIILIDGLKNPTSSATSASFIVKTIDVENSAYYFIDQVNDGLVLNSNCNYPCNGCLSNYPSNCTSCYTSSSFNKLQGDTCVQECATGKYFDSKTLKCTDCQSPCLGCSSSSTNCTQCGIGDALYLFSNTCRSDCPSGYVTDPLNNKCQICDKNCLTCSITASQCTSCIKTSTTPFLYQSSCVKTCPPNISVPGNGVCQECDSSCKTCSGSQQTCTSCLSHMKFDSIKNTCTAVCQEGKQIYNQSSSQCLYCDSSCSTCAGTTKTCTSCKSGQTLNFDNTCKSSCGKDDQTSINGICKQCELPCSSCKNSVNHCIKCQGDYLLFNTTCVQYCPEKFEPNNSTRQCILVGLICPEGFTVNEAGDGCIPNEFECPEGQMINQQRTACVPKPGSPVPFPFLFFSSMLCLLVLGSYIKDKFFTKIYSNLIALLGVQEMLIYLLMLGYSGAIQSWGPFVLSLIAVLMLMTSNIVFYLMYKKEILKDEAFSKWCRLFPKTTKSIPLMVLFVNFKSIKLYYSGFFGLESCLAQFDEPMKNLFRPMRLVTYFSFIFIYIPIIIADIIIFATVPWGNQLLVLGVESFLLTLAMIVLTFLEFKNPEQLILRGDEQYTRIKPKSFINDTMVMGGMVDVDETTLVRGKVIDDDYEVFLRKKAFVSVINQVKKNYDQSNKMGFNLGGNIDQIMSKFDEKQLKYRRAFSLEDIDEEESWYISSDDDNIYKTKKPADEEFDRDEYLRQRRHSYPLLNKSKENIQDPQFKRIIQEIKQAVNDQLGDNVYADCKAPDKNKEKNRKKTVSRRTQTYLRELLQIEGDDLNDSDLEIIMEDEAEIDGEYARDLIDGVIDGLSESESNLGGKRRGKKKRKNLNNKRTQQIPDFELADIMGDFEIDDLGNFIILRGEKGELLDKKERRVNRRGYLIDRFGNIINKSGQVIFKAVELDSDDEIPAPYGFEKRKKNLLNLGQDGEFKVDGQDKQIEDDEDMIDRELKQMRKSMKKTKRKQLPDGQIVEEELDEDDDESSIDSLMAESPGKYQIDQLGQNEDDIIANITKKKIPVKRGQKGVKKSGRKDEYSPEDSQRKKAGPMQNLPPKRIKREDTRDMFPSLAIEGPEQRKLFKIAEKIGSMANQMAETQKKNNMNSTISSQNHQNQANQENLERLKQEHFKDLINESQQKNPTDKKGGLPPRPNMDKIYGNLGDVVNYEEQLMKEQLKGMRAQSPFSSQMTSRMAFRQENMSSLGDKRRLRGLESIYLQKFDKKTGGPSHKKIDKAKFRNTLQQFVDDPEFLVDDGIDRQKQNEMSLMVADKLDRLQKQYMSNTATSRFQGVGPQSSSQAFMPTVGASLGKRASSISKSIFNQDPSLDPIKMGNWLPKGNNV